MHVLAHLLQALLVGNAEVLLLVDDEQPEALEVDRLAEQRVRADHDVDRAVGQPLLRLRERRRADEARRLRDANGQALEALDEGLVVLARQQRRRHDDRDLQPVHGGDEGRPQRHLGLAEADVAADEAVHRPAGGQIAEHRLDARVLVLGFLVGEAGDELVVGALPARRLDGASLSWRRAAILISSEAISRRRFLRRALRDCQATPPSLSSCPSDFIGAVARQQLDVLHRQEQLVAAGVLQLQAVVRGLENGDGLEA